MTFKELLVKHSYYCSDSNYYSNDATMTYASFKKFYDEFIEADVDFNMCFRFDIIEDEETHLYSASICLMQQRKGKFVPILIENVIETDFDMMYEYLSKHWQYIKELWKPFTY